MRSTVKRVLMAELVESLGEVELRPPPGSPKGTVGSVVQVISFDGVCAELYDEYQKGSKDNTLLWKVVERIIPGATPREVLSLTPGECVALVAMASGKAEQILKEMREAEEADEDAGSGGTEGNRKAPARKKAKARRRRTGSPS